MKKSTQSDVTDKEIPLVCPACGEEGRIHHIITVNEDRLLTRLEKVGCGYDNTYEVYDFSPELEDEKESVVCYACGKEWKNIDEFVQTVCNTDNDQQS